VGLRQLAWVACAPGAGAARFVAQSGGGAAAAAAAAVGASVAPHDAYWCKTAARLRCKLALGCGGGGGEGEGECAGEGEGDMAAAEAAAAAVAAGSTGPALPKSGDRGAATAAAIACLSPSLPYEARAAAMKALRDAAPAAVAAAMDVAALRRYVASTVLPGETRHSCSRRALELIASWTPAGSDGGGGFGGGAQDVAEWGVIEALASSSPNERVRCEALRCLGKMAAARICLWELETGRMHPAPPGLAGVGKQAASLVALIAAGASSMRSSDTREAAADALASSTLLACLPTAGAAAAAAAGGARAGGEDAAAPGPLLGEPILRAWLAAFELMEDEDEDVRDATAAAAAAAVGVAPDTQTEEALRRSFAVAAVRMARWPPYERYLVGRCRLTLSNLH